MFAEGLGVPQDLGEARRLYELAAERGEFLAQIELGRVYSRGVGVSIDHSRATRWYAAALAQEGEIVDCEELSEARVYLIQRG